MFIVDVDIPLLLSILASIRSSSIIVVICWLVFCRKLFSKVLQRYRLYILNLTVNLFLNTQLLIIQNEIPSLPSQSIRSTGCRFARRDPCRTWNTGNFGPDAICLSVDRPGIAIAGAVVYSGTGSYEYQLELLYDTLESPAQHKWETLETVSGTYDQDIVNNEMVELKFERPVHIKVIIIQLQYSDLTRPILK